MNQRCTIMTELVYVFQTASLCPNSYATSDARQMRVTDEDTLLCAWCLWCVWCVVWVCDVCDVCDGCGVCAVCGGV